VIEIELYILKSDGEKRRIRRKEGIIIHMYLDRLKRLIR
jgi:hypothetical protein